MNHKLLYKLSFLFFLLLLPFLTNAQTVKKGNSTHTHQHIADSAKNARIQKLDSLKTARQRTVDSMQKVREARLASIKLVQKHRLDSIRAVRAYRESKQYKDSVAAVLQHRKDSILAVRQRIIDSTQKARQHYADSLIAARKHSSDSLKKVRQHYTDSLHAYFDSVKVARAKTLEKLKVERKHRTDSLDAIRTYRESDRFKDSLALVRKHRRDSLITIRKHFTDSVRAAQKAYTDSLTAARKVYNDSLHNALARMKAVRQRMIDSLTAIRKVRADSLAKVIATRKADFDKKEKEREKKKVLALQIQIQKQHDSYSNKKMLQKKWSFLRKVMQNTFTRYNYYYNTNLKMEQARSNMLMANQDDYDSLLQLFPFNPNKDSAKLVPDMDTIIKKASVGIQIHDPRSKWQDDLYLLVGEAYYYKADYKNAGNAFKQIIVTDEKAQKEKEKKKKGKQEDDLLSFSTPRKKGIAGLIQHVPAKNKAMLWLARTLVQIGKEGQAQTLLSLLSSDPNFPKQLKGRLALEQSFINLKNDDNKNAIQSLSIVAKDEYTPKWQRQRAGYIAGQLFEQDHQLDSANSFFKKVIAMHPPIQMDFYARKNIAFNELSKSGNENQSVQSLENLAEDGKYKPFYDQIYYGIALAELKTGDQDKAMSDLRKSLSFGKTNQKQLGLTYTQIGDIDYEKQAYLPAKRAYDSAAVLLKQFPGLPEYQRASLRGTSLSEIVSPAKNVVRLDSLIHLASLTEKEQRSIIRKYIHELEKEKRDSLFLAQNSSQNNSGGNLFNNPVASATGWYFSDPAQVIKGEMTFKQKWGDRKLADNWWLNSNNFSGDASAGDNSNQSNENENSGIPDEDVLFALIPHTKEALKAAKDTLQESLFLLGKGYYTYLEDFKNATKTFDTLDKQFPSNPHQAEVLYLRYLIALRSNNPSYAKNYLNLLTQNFPQSKWTTLLLEANKQQEKTSEKSTENLTEKPIDAYYNETYNMLQQKQYSLVLKRAKNLSSTYTNPGNYLYKFRILEAVAYGGSGNYHSADSILTVFVKQKPDTALTGWAQTLLNYFYHLENPSATTSNSNAEAKPETHFTYNPAEAYFIIIGAPADTRIFALKSSLQDFNLTQKQDKNIGIYITTLNPNENLIVCQVFKNLQDAEGYFKDILKDAKLFSDYPAKEYHLLLISQSNYTKMTAQRSLQEYIGFYKKYFHQ